MKAIRVLILGGGGHAAVVGDAILAARGASGLDIAAYLDDDAKKLGCELPGGRIVGPFADRTRVNHDAVIVAIGNAAVRAQWFERLAGEGAEFATVIHPTAVVATDVTIGAGSMLLAGTIVNTGARIGRNVILNTACSVDHHSQIADHVHIAPGARLGGDVSVGAGALVGIGAAVLPGRSIAAHAVVGGGAVVTDDVPEGVVVVGLPARPLSARP